MTQCSSLLQHWITFTHYKSVPSFSTVLALGRCLEHVAGRKRLGKAEQVNFTLPALEQSSYSWLEPL